MLKRKIYDDIIAWKKSKHHECLLIEGARQVGKTYIVDQVGKEQYQSYVTLNFYRNPEYKQIFEGSLEPEEIYKKISLSVSHVQYVEHNTLIFLDEIQECPQARTALKFLAMDDRYDVIATGSMLGLNFKNMASVPVGYERKIKMYSLDFEEFLWARGKSEENVSLLKDTFVHRKKLADSAHVVFTNLMREYLIVGGMPEVVNTFLSTNNFQEVHDVQMKILNSYQDDIMHYASASMRQKIRDCYLSLPRQLAKDYTKFQYKVVGAGGSARKYENCLNWLVDAGMIRLCMNVSTPQFPLAAYEKPEQFKAYMTDIGLLCALYGFETQSALVQDTLTGPVKGGIYENLIFDMLNKKGAVLHYYKNDQSTQEIEFLIEREGSVIPIEVKSKKGSTISLNHFIQTYQPPYAYKLEAGNLGVHDRKITLPHYMAMFL